MIGPAGRRAAWDAYMALTQRLLPALQDEVGGPARNRDSRVNPALGAVAIRVRRYAPMWGDHGPMLIAAVDSAIRLLRHGDRAALGGLLQVLARRLFLLSASPHPRAGGNLKVIGPPPKPTDPPQETPSA